MVLGKTKKRETLVDYNISRIIFESLFLVLTICVCIICGLILSANVGDQSPTHITEIVPDEPIPVPNDEAQLPPRIDFQPVIDQWTRSTSGNRSVLIYDPLRKEIVGSYNPDEVYNTASLYKLFVVYEGYRRIISEEWNPDDMAGSSGRTILECLDLAIRESYSPCAEALWNMIGHAELDEIISNEYAIHSSDISSLLSTPNDILLIMEKFYALPDSLPNYLNTTLKDSFLNQPTTTYNWRQGLPSGFSAAKVYNKVGWDYNPDGRFWNIYHDAAIVEFLDGERPYIIVVMTNRVPYQEIKRLGSEIEKYYLDSFNSQISN